MYCEDTDAWGGVGYYFWDSFIDLAHFWGEIRCKKKYLIARAEIDVSDKCLDLHNNPEHIEEISGTLELLNKINKGEKLPVTLCTIITYLRDQGLLGNYEGVRFLGRNSISRIKSKKFTSVLHVSKDLKKAYQTIDLCPPIQFCLFNLDSLNLKNYSVVFDSDHAYY